MTRLTRAELVDLVRRLVDAERNGGALSHAVFIEAERALKTEETTKEWRSAGSHLYLQEIDHLLTTRPSIGAMWLWEVRGETAVDVENGLLASGYASTEAEAQQAALDAAKELAETASEETTDDR
jgi:hypothetical protein